MSNYLTIPVLLIDSCDKYEDAWEICSNSLKNSWSDCPYRKVLLTESKDIPRGCEFDSVINVKSTGWSEMLHEALEQITSEYIVFMLEDQWSVTNVEQDNINLALEYMNNNVDVAVIYFENSKSKGIKKSQEINEDFNEIPFGSPYRLSCAPGLFRKDFLYDVTKRNISPWDFERIMSFDDSGSGVRVLELKNSNWTRIDETGAIYRGKWVPGVKDYADSIGVKLDLNVRAEQSRWDVFKRKTKDFIFNINPDIVVGIQRKLKHI